MIHIAIHVRRYHTVGFHGTRPEQTAARVVLQGGGHEATLWNEDSGRGFCSYGSASILPAAREYAQSVANVLGCNVSVHEGGNP